MSSSLSRVIAKTSLQILLGNPLLAFLIICDCKMSRNHQTHNLFQPRHSIFLITLFFFWNLFGISTAREKWTMQLCISGKMYSMTDSSCKSAIGVWFTRPRKIYKACFDGGVWAIYKTWCEPNPVIWTAGTGNADTGCIKESLLESVSGLVYVGNAEDGVTLSTSNQRLFLGQSSHSWNLLDSEMSLISWGHRKPYSIREETRGHRSLPSRSKCFLGGTPFFKQYKFRATQITGVSFSLQQENCQLETGNWEKILPLSGAKSDMRIEESVQEWAQDKPFVCPDSDEIRQNEAYCDQMYGRDHPIGADNNVDEQSARVALKFHAHVFNGLEIPEMTFHEWKIYQLVKLIFETVCPAQLVPRFFYNQIMPLFQYLILESLARYPVHEQMDNQTYSRIETALHNCILSSREFTFSQNNDTCQTDNIQIEYTNGTVVSAPVVLPDNVRNDFPKFDIIMESAWKMLLFSHYQCADHFRAFSSDLSVFYFRWQALLLAPDLQERWVNPGKSHDMMKQIFMSINLNRTLMNVDYCVAAAQMQSVYTGWMKRPVEKAQKKRRRIVTSELTWDGHAYCMDDYLYPALYLGYPIDICGLKFSRKG